MKNTDTTQRGQGLPAEHGSACRAPRGGIAVDGQRYEGGQFVPGAGEYQRRRAACERRAREGDDKLTTKQGIVFLVGDAVIVNGFTSDRSAVISRIRGTEFRVRFSDGETEWWPSWAISPNVRGDSCAESALSPPPCSGLLWFFGLLRPTCVKDWLAVIALAVALLAWFRPQWEPWLRADTPTRGNPETMTEAR